MRKTTKLKQLFERSEIFVLAGGFNAMHTKMAEAIGFEACYMSGYGTSANLVGMPDAGLTTMSEVVMNAGYMANAVSIPLLADSDTGWGNAINVRRTISEFIRAGVAGIHLEDQESPKKCGGLAGRRVLPMEEAVGKYRAAVDAKKELDPDFVIMARTDARGAEGGSFEEAIKRARAYRHDAGVDVVFVEALQTFDEVKEACRILDCPVVCLLHGVIQPPPGLEEQQAAGLSAALYPGLCNMAGQQANWEFLNDFKERGVEAMRDLQARTEKARWRFPIMHDFIGFPQIQEWEAKYLPQEQQRDYEHSIGWRAS